MLSWPIRANDSIAIRDIVEDHRGCEDDGQDRRQQAGLMLAMPLRRRSVTGMPCSAATNTSYPSQRLGGASNRNQSCSRSWGRHRCRSPHLAGHDGHLCAPSETVCRDHGRVHRRRYARHLDVTRCLYPCQRPCRAHRAAPCVELPRDQRSCQLERMPPLVQSLCRWPARTRQPLP